MMEIACQFSLHHILLTLGMQGTFFVLNPDSFFLCLIKDKKECDNGVFIISNVKGGFDHCAITCTMLVLHKRLYIHVHVRIYMYVHTYMHRAFSQLIIIPLFPPLFKALLSAKIASHLIGDLVLEGEFSSKTLIPQTLSLTHLHVVVQNV